MKERPCQGARSADCEGVDMSKSNQVARVCGCGKRFRGAHLRCTACREVLRVCACGEVFRGLLSRCGPCQSQDRTCSCGKDFKGRGRLCGVCRAIDRVCICGKAFRGQTKQCKACRMRDRVCACGAVFRGDELKCGACSVVPQECTSCGSRFRGRRGTCPTCSGRRARVCDCGKRFRGTNTACSACQRARKDPAKVSALNRSNINKRRARKAAAEIQGPVPASVYRKIRDAGVCVYCGGPGRTVDHIRPLARGGWEHESNLVSACESCNYSKGAKLLRDWNQDRVAHAVRVSVLVAEAYEREEK
jgi:hypothetical protein